MIPKIVHYCWLSNDPIPDKLQGYMKSWKEKLVGYDFILWDFKRFDINSSLWVKQAFEAKKYATASDYIRLYAVYHYGGIYMDMDIEVIKPFDELLNNNYMIAYENNENKDVEAGCFGSVKESLYIKECLDYYKDRQFTLEIYKDGYTLPRVMKKTVDSSMIQKDLFFYTEDFFTAKSFVTGLINITDNTYCIHHFAGSWLIEKDKKDVLIRYKIYHFLGINYFSRLVLIFIFFIKRIKRTGLLNILSYFIKKLFSLKHK